MKREPNDLLSQCLSDSIEDNRISVSTFFTQWFRMFGTPYYFLFRKNLRVTNIQVAELIALLRRHTRGPDNNRIRGLNLISSSEFRAGLEKLIDSFSDLSNTNDLIQQLVQYIAPLAQNTIIYDVYFGSALVMLPPGLFCDMALICSLSGYIYACGPNLLFRNINKVTEHLLFDALDNFVKRGLPDKALPVRLVIYAHEDFTKHDRSKAAELINGLDDVKIFIEKYYIGNQRLVEVLSNIESRFQNQLHLLEPGPFHEINQKARQDCDPNRTLWLVIDHGICDVKRLKSDDQYLICYEQLYFNDNPLHIFDENKPAWIDHTTIPHTLMGAMLNITSPWWPDDRVPIIGDPFVGTGTAWLEATKCGLETNCSDLLPIADILCQDNAWFLSRSAKELSKLSEGINEAEKISLTTLLLPQFSRKRPTRAFLAKRWLAEILKLIPDEPSGELVTTSVAEELRKQSDILHRILFYIALRTRRRHTASFMRLSEDWEEAYRMESTGLVRQIEALIETYVRMSEGKKQSNSVILFPGDYSQSVCLSIVDRLVSNDTSPVRAGADVRNFARRSCDIIITDPPYGFNADIAPSKLASLLQETIGIILDALVDDAQLVIALPDWSHIGRELPFFVLKEMFTQQVILAASQRNMEIIGSNYGVPPPGWLCRPPYYWESARALRRAILHFRFHRNGERSQVKPTPVDN